MFKVNNRNTGTRCEICSKLATKTPERRQLLLSGVLIVNFEHISRLVSIADFDQVNVDWVLGPSLIELNSEGIKSSLARKIY